MIKKLNKESWLVICDRIVVGFFEGADAYHRAKHFAGRSEYDGKFVLIARSVSSSDGIEPREEDLINAYSWKPRRRLGGNNVYGENWFYSGVDPVAETRIPGSEYQMLQTAETNQRWEDEIRRYFAPATPESEVRPTPTGDGLLAQVNASNQSVSERMESHVRENGLSGQDAIQRASEYYSRWVDSYNQIPNLPQRTV